MKTFFQYLEIHINTKRLFEQKNKTKKGKAERSTINRKSEMNYISIKIQKCSGNFRCISILIQS
ncbi:hypothetical protein DXA95_14555 [Odoribacter sp. OF09-27XD]|nr:hypothetical protein DXA95_14555 [Odoribacter sp. OF09-27XD]